MKKLFALMLALCLLCSVAMAEENALVWNDEVDAAASQFGGQFYTFKNISVKFWIPDILQQVELSEEDIEEGTIAYFQAADESAAVCFQYVDMNGTSLEDYAATLVENGVDEESIEPGTVNGISCLSYEYNGNGVLAFATQMGYILEVAAGPMDDEGFQQLASVIFCSIQAAE